MDLFGRFNDGPQPVSPSAVAVYVGGHLAPTLEAGDLEEVPGYLSREGTIVPMVSDPDLWREVGWDPGKHPLPSGKLIQNLTQGFDLKGHKLAGRGQFRAPREVVFSLPSELSVALMALPAVQRLGVMQDLHRAWTQERDKVAVRIMRAGDRTWEAGRTLSLGFVHLEDRAGEPSLHFHDYAFAVAKDETGRWRAYDNGKVANDMPRLRAKLTDQAIASCARFGVQIDWPRGLARERDGQVQGVTVTLPSGRVIEAGSLSRTRRADILAAQSIRETLEVPALTPRELEIVRRETGKLPLEISGVRRRDYLVEKLNKLGLLDEAGRILPRQEVEGRLPRIAEGLEIAAAKLREIPLQGPRAEAVARVEQKIEAITVAVPEIAPQVQAAQAAGKLRWTVDYQRVMEMVAAAGTLRTDGLTKPDRDLLSKMKKAGVLEGEKINGRMEYRLSEVGRLRVSRGTVVHTAGPALPSVVPLAPGALEPGGAGCLRTDWGAAAAARAEVGALGEIEPRVADVELPAAGSPGALPVRTPEMGGPEGYRVSDLGPGAIPQPGAIQSKTAAPAELYPGGEIRIGSAAALVAGACRGQKTDVPVGSLQPGDGRRPGDHLAEDAQDPGNPLPSVEGGAHGEPARHDLPFGEVHGPAGLPGAGGPDHALPRAGQVGGRGRGYHAEAHPRLGSHPRRTWDGGSRRSVHPGPARMATVRGGWAHPADEPGSAGRHRFGGGVGKDHGIGRFGRGAFNRPGPARMVAPLILQRGPCNGAKGVVQHVLHVPARATASRAGTFIWDLMAAAAGAAIAAGQMVIRRLAEIEQKRVLEVARIKAAEMETTKRKAAELEAARIKIEQQKIARQQEQEVENPPLPKIKPSRGFGR